MTKLALNSPTNGSKSRAICVEYTQQEAAVFRGRGSHPHFVGSSTPVYSLLALLVVLLMDSIVIRTHDVPKNHVFPYDYAPFFGSDFTRKKKSGNSTLAVLQLCRKCGSLSFYFYLSAGGFKVVQVCADALVFTLNRPDPPPIAPNPPPVTAERSSPPVSWRSPLQCRVRREVGWVGFFVVCFLYQITPNPPVLAVGKSGPNVHF